MPMVLSYRIESLDYEVLKICRLCQFHYPQLPSLPITQIPPIQQRNLTIFRHDFVYPDFIGWVIVMNTKLGDQEDGDAVIRSLHFLWCGQVNDFLQIGDQSWVVQGVFEFFHSSILSPNTITALSRIVMGLYLITRFMAL